MIAALWADSADSIWLQAPAGFRDWAPELNNKAAAEMAHVGTLIEVLGRPPASIKASDPPAIVGLCHEPADSGNPRAMRCNFRVSALAADSVYWIPKGEIRIRPEKGQPPRCLFAVFGDAVVRLTRGADGFYQNLDAFVVSADRSGSISVFLGAPRGVEDQPLDLYQDGSEWVCNMYCLGHASDRKRTCHGSETWTSIVGFVCTILGWILARIVPPW